MRLVVLVPVLYLAAFVWENVMLAKPEPTRYIILGVLLDRADDPASDRPARREARGDHLVVAEKLLELQRRLDGVRRPHASSTASTSTSTRARSSA